MTDHQRFLDEISYHKCPDLWLLTIQWIVVKGVSLGCLLWIRAAIKYKMNKCFSTLSTNNAYSKQLVHIPSSEFIVTNLTPHFTHWNYKLPTQRSDSVYVVNPGCERPILCTLLTFVDIASHNESYFVGRSIECMRIYVCILFGQAW